GFVLAEFSSAQGLQLFRLFPCAPSSLRPPIPFASTRRFIQGPYLLHHLGPAENPEHVADRVFLPSSEQRETLRRELLVQLEEEQRSDAKEIGKKTTGATCEGFQASRRSRRLVNMI
ncbi:MAG: hypothetical protein FWD69_16385, partial [Polyangiaceae bacterium]|nr:hypothetical protein [Polyangiaceae bacterium]